MLSRFLCQDTKTTNGCQRAQMFVSVDGVTHQLVSSPTTQPNLTALMLKSLLFLTVTLETVTMVPSLRVCSAPVFPAAVRTRAKVTLVDQQPTMVKLLVPPRGVMDVPKPTIQVSTLMLRNTATGSMEKCTKKSRKNPSITNK